MSKIMPTTITLKNIPDEIYVRLKETADAHHRSLNSEIIACLETLLMPSRMKIEEHLLRARKMREMLAYANFEAADIDAAIEQGRP
jgi:plasmid stability protein